MAQDSSNIWLECLESHETTTLLCELCQGLTIAKLRRPNFYRHAENRAALQVSAQNCRLCAIIERVICRSEGGLGYGPQLQFGGAIGAAWFDTEEEREERDSWALKLALVPYNWEVAPENKPLKELSSFAYIGVWLNSETAATDLHLVVEEGDPLGGKRGCEPEDFQVVGRTIASQEVPHEALFELVRGWMAVCFLDKRHRVCAPAPWDETPLLPSRVIDVTEDGSDPQLVISGGQRGHYAALSHCWGGSQLLQTTTATLAQYQDRIPMDQLPKSFKDAIIIARKLWIPFLWIDSLCIIQDSEQDWHHEAALMSSVYRNSMLTISATSAENGSHGCFIPEIYPNIVRLPQSFFPGADGKAYVTDGSLVSNSLWGDKVASGPLFRRAWTLQERCLSRRILHCCRGQWLWECCERVEAQYGFSEERTHASHPSFLGRIETMNRAYSGVYEFDRDVEEDFSTDEGKYSGTGAGHGEQRAAQFQSTGQPACQDTAKDKDDGSTIEETKDTTALERLEAVHIETSAEDEQQQQEPVPKSFTRSLAAPTNGRSTYVIDLRPDAISKPSLKPTLLNRAIDNDLYDFLDVASRECRYKIWYDLVKDYTGRRLTKGSDKLPAIAGLAAAIHEIVQDSYLAGHWYVELGRSLFWRMDWEAKSQAPARCREYRAPSWAWPSVEGGVQWKWPDLSPGKGEEAPLRIVNVEVELISDDNPFGLVKGGSLTLECRTTWVVWDEDASTYITSGFEDDPVRPVHDWDILYAEEPTMPVRNRRNESVGSWECDDVLNTVFPATKITPDMTMEELEGRRIPLKGCARWAKESINDLDPGRRFTALPSELLCLRGPTKYTEEKVWANGCFEDGQETEIRTTCSIKTLLLARTEDPSGKVFRRVGTAAFSQWDESEEMIEKITII